VERDELLRTLAFADAGMWGGIIFPEKLPAIAADLLVRGADSPTLRELAADLEPVDPRDIRDLYQHLIEETEAPTLELGERVEVASQLLAAAVEGWPVTRSGVPGVVRKVGDHRPLPRHFRFDGHVRHEGRT
jgi:hypothetical protein